MDLNHDKVIQSSLLQQSLFSNRLAIETPIVPSATGSSDLGQRGDSLCQSFRADMRVVSAHRLGVVPNQLHDDGFRDTSILQQ
jgi:hypothetical protein